MDPVDYAQARDAEITADSLAKRAAARALELARPGRVDCVQCKLPIGRARRAAMPQARTCIECAIKAERQPIMGVRRR